MANPDKAWQATKPIIESSVIRTAVISMLGYLATKYGIPDDILTPEAASIIADVIVIGGGAVIAYLRKTRTHVPLSGWLREQE